MPATVLCVRACSKQADDERRQITAAERQLMAADILIPTNKIGTRIRTNGQYTPPATLSLERFIIINQSPSSYYIPIGHQSPLLCDIWQLHSYIDVLY